MSGEHGQCLSARYYHHLAHWFAPHVLVECSVGDEILYHHDLSGITAPKLDATDKAAIYDLSGRRLQAIPQRGVYIVNGKKYIR